MQYIFLLAVFLLLWTLLEFLLKKYFRRPKAARPQPTIINQDIALKPGLNLRPQSILLKGVLKTYPSGEGQIKAVDIPDLQIKKGEFIAVMGRSGSGKSTLLNLTGGLDKPTQGRIILDNVDLTTASQSELTRIRNQKIGFVFQEYNLIPTLTALENVALPLKYRHLPKWEQLEKATAMLAQVGLKDRMHHFPTQLSGGENQRVTIARALVNNPTLVLADEPTGEVDTQTANEILTIMKKLNSSFETTFIIVTHDPGVAAKTNRIITLQDGKIVTDQAYQDNSELT